MSEGGVDRPEVRARPQGSYRAQMRHVMMMANLVYNR